MPPDLLDDTAPSASLDYLKAQAASTHPRAPPEHLGSPLWPQELASGRPKVENSPLSTTRQGLPQPHLSATPPSDCHFIPCRTGPRLDLGPPAARQREHYCAARLPVLRSRLPMGGGQQGLGADGKDSPARGGGLRPHLSSARCGRDASLVFALNVPCSRLISRNRQTSGMD